MHLWDSLTRYGARNTKQISSCCPNKLKISLKIWENNKCFLENDTIIFFDYRADRMREITECVGMERYKDLDSDVPHPKNMVRSAVFRN